MVSQILLLREMVVACYGNELSFAIMLSAWLLWVGLGSLVGGPWARRIIRPEKTLSVLYLLLGFLLPASLLLIRSARSWLGISPGEVMSLPSILLLSLLFSLPLCLLLGLLFVFNARLFGQAGGEGGKGVSLVYVWEAMGAFLGGIVSTYLLIPHLSNLKISFLILLLNLFSALYFVGFSRVRSVLVGGVLLLGFLILLILRVPSGLDLLSWKWHWRDLNLRETTDSIYGNIAVGERYGQTSLYENGLHLFSSPDPAAAEEAVHYALLQHPDPHSLFLLGGGMGGGLVQALKYPDLSIDYAELDPRIIDLSAQHLPWEQEALQNPRVKVWYGDGRALLRSSRRRYDVIILNLPDPRTLQLNRFYTREFFEIVKQRLSPGGVFSFRVSSSENYLSPDQAEYLALLKNTVQAVFAEVVAFPGETCIFFASLQEGLLLRSDKDLIRRLQGRHLDNQYVSEFLIPFRLHPFKIRYLEDRLKGQNGRINRDMKPICYLYQSALWASQFGSWERRIFSFILQVPWGYILIFLLGLVALLVAAQAVKGSYLIGSVLGSVFVTGLTSISLEITALLAFQVFYGYIYYKIGLLLAAFMLGLGMGAAWGKRRQASLEWLLLFQAILMGLCLLFWLGLRESPITAIPSAGMDLLFSLSLLTVGIVGGAQFCLANDLFLKDRRQPGWGTVYAVDLWGSAPGALLFSALLIPRWGIFQSLWLLAILNLTVLFALSLNKLRRGSRRIR
jgi:spermidine synthase